MEWYLKVVKNYVGFEGRARRKEYWMFVLFNLIIAVVLAIIDGVMGLRTSSGFGMLGGLYALAVLLPSIAVGVRRLHDVDKSGWWLLIVFIPLIGAILLIVWYATDGNRGDNRFGPDPKAGAEGHPVAA